MKNVKENQMAKYILRTQINEILSHLIGDEIDASIISFDRDISENIFKYKLPFTLNVKKTDFHFTINHSFRGFNAFYCPDPYKEIIVSGHKAQLKWSSVISLYSKWLTKVYHEISAPDPFSFLYQVEFLKRDFSYIPDTEKFSDEELHKINKYLQVMKELTLEESIFWVWQYHSYGIKAINALKYIHFTNWM